MEAPPDSTVFQAVRPGDDIATLPVRPTDDPTVPAVARIDPDKTHPYRTTELVKEVNAILPENAKINPYHIQCIRKLHNIDANSSFYHLPKFGSPQYSPAFVDWLIEQYREDPLFFEKAKQEIHRRKQSKKSH